MCKSLFLCNHKDKITFVRSTTHLSICTFKTMWKMGEEMRTNFEIWEKNSLQSSPMLPSTWMKVKAYIKKYRQLKPWKYLRTIHSLLYEIMNLLHCLPDITVYFHCRMIDILTKHKCINVIFFILYECVQKFLSFKGISNASYHISCPYAVKE